MIFALHRAEPKDFLSQDSSTSEALMEFKEKHATVLKLFHRAAVDLQGSNYYRYQRSISGAMQEYIEAMTLQYYMVHGKLIPKETLEADLVFMTSQEQLNNLDSIITIGQTGLPGSGGSGGGQRGKFIKDNRKVSYNRDDKKLGKKIAPASESLTTTTPAASTNPISAPPVPINIDEPANRATIAPPSTTTTMQMDDPLVVIPVVLETKLIRHTLEITDEDYLLGIADLTGELMRLAINTLGQSLMTPATQDTNIATGASYSLSTPEKRVQHILSFLRDIKSGFDGLSLTKMSPISKKMGTLKQSLNKIEMACYNVKVRGAEYPPEILRQMLMSGGASGQDVGGVEAGNGEEEQ
ncbi:hypothetical protein BX616_002948 [Lobosporangium transversale]|nr:hypothetical protein BX616_002948 [Lobosporangium transversale]